MANRNKVERVLSFLQNGSDLTVGQARAKFGVQIKSVATALREQGYAVYANTKRNTNGDKFTTYRLGSPTRAVVAAGFRALQAA